VRIQFDKIEMKAKRVWTENGKRRQQTKVFMQTVNPFNKNADGTVKTREQIHKELLAERKAWLDLAKRCAPMHPDHVLAAFGEDAS
jgi:hypothetical protein